MIILEPISVANVAVFRSIRLRALQDAPGAFGSTFARESQFSDAEWMQRALNWDGERGIGLVALDDGVACGLAGTFLNVEDATQAELISMWTAPTHRRAGVGRLLVNAIAGWAFQRGARRLRLMVTSNNESAIRFYERLGFSFTGRTEPYANDPSVHEKEMARVLSSEEL